MSMPYGQPPPAQQQPGPTSSPGGGLGLSKILAIAPGGLGLVIYFLSFTDGAGGYLRDLVGVLLLGGGLLAASSALPKASATLVPATVSVLTGALFLLVAVAKGPAFLELPGAAGETPALAVVAVILALLESAACVAAVLLQAGVVKMATSRPSTFPQRSWAPQQPGGYHGGPPQGGYQGAPGGYPGVQVPGGGYPGAPGGYPGAPGGYPSGQPQGGYQGSAGGYLAAPGPGGYPGGPGPGGYLGQPPVGPSSGGAASQPQPDISQTVEYRGLQDPYGGQPAQSGGQPGHYSPEPGRYGSEPGLFSESGRYGSELGQYKSEPGKYSGEPGNHSSEPGNHSSEPGQYGSEPGQYSSEPEQRADETEQPGRYNERRNASPGDFGSPDKG
ncbi:MAG: DUF5336 domain-containing protein [Pseudonocardiaceae bacterium]